MFLMQMQPLALAKCSKENRKLVSRIHYRNVRNCKKFCNFQTLRIIPWTISSKGSAPKPLARREEKVGTVTEKWE